MNLEKKIYDINEFNKEEEKIKIPKNENKMKIK